MDIGKAFTFAFEDDDKIAKLLIGAIIAIIPIVNFAALGYVAELVRNVRAGQDRPLPAWDRFGEYFVDGCKIIIGWLVYFVPVLLLTCAFTVVAIGVSEGVNPSDAEAVMSVVAICFTCLIIPLAFIPYLAIPAVLVRYAETGEIGPLFDFASLWAFVQENSGGYLVVVLISFAMIQFIAPLGIIACGVGIFFTQWWAYLVTGHLTGQLARSNDLQV
jgi:hypothetical protein